MSGVFGYCSLESGGAALSTVERMAAALRHVPRQVTSCGSPGPSVALGHIGIGVFNRAHQPVRSCDGRIWLSLVGEFYDQAARRARLVAEERLASDADEASLALAVYEADGADGLTTLDGMFTVAVWDDRSGELVLVNDRYGLYPHFIAHVGRGFAFGPEIKAVACAPHVPRRLDRVALAQYVRFQQLLGDRTWLEHVSLLRPASLLRYQAAEDRVSVRRYWDWDRVTEQPAMAFEDAVSEITRRFQRAIDLRTAPPQRIGVYLSGGLDGRMILGFIDGRVPVEAITYGASDCRDVRYARRLARVAGCRHHWFPMDDGRWVIEHAALHLALTEGQHSWMHGHGMSTLRRAGDLFDVALTGWRSGRLMTGRRRRPEPEALTVSDLERVAFECLCSRWAWPGLNEAEASLLFSGAGDRSLRPLAFESVREEIARMAHYQPDRRLDYFRLHNHDCRSTLNLVVFTRAAVEVRCPYYDYELVEFLVSMPPQVRRTPMLRRTIVTRRMPRLARVPDERDNRLPHASPWIEKPHTTWLRAKSFVNRRVAPVFREYPRLYADYERYLRTDLREWGERILFDPRTLARGFFDPEAVRMLWDRHQSGAETWTIGKIAPLITIELVLRELIDRD